MARFPAHAKSRMLERSISEAEFKAAIEDPLETVETRYGRTAVCAGSAGKYLVVILEKASGELIVVTALKVDKARARRYGFSRV